MFLCGKSSQEYPNNADVFYGSNLDPKLFPLCINYLPDDVICNSAIKADDATPNSKCNRVSDLWLQLELASEVESEQRDNVEWDRKWLTDFNAAKSQLISFERYSNSGAIDAKMDESVLEKKSSFKILGLSFFLNWIGALKLSLFP